MWSEFVQRKVVEDDIDMLPFKYGYEIDCKRCNFFSLQRESHWQRRKTYSCYEKRE